MKTNTLILIVIAVVALGGLFFLLKPKTAPITTTENQNQIVVAEQTPQPNVFELVIEDKKLVSGPATIKVNQGEDVTIKIISDEAEEFHLHAYDESAELEVGKQAVLIFKANLSGRFPFELENSKIEIGVLEVQPKSK
ncbi:MAG: hypothetical protein ACD_30C00056G0004 [uncultured bacterium]|uniref:EfeO-type cupredoxin-like domain-containing protein n=4 Tax=Candidatus Daviesiibacteriota TaxID=1752718 RepID=A0A0G0HAV8_9BACT|nr:MAG: hypothetical protein ACD_30C00056G0004 [uncultured bacterium]KKQ09219.1 MAG: hypothetical protein US19_C0015G0012 [Candidatus Daviesbacteria bacterium GW2011_GWB1_36_5]KKQ14730.1 MAG: hypothetical protein US28_C0031G0013 [Candidatus Daviesbacteria bacterium GW2011_GWA1_36_8]OGE17060.1 MAG: hypothetical protein A2858_01510 [Candidatus Daviesbacteria bacterium RIFCSPHIGHO2_01_FULL_36_37]OGE32693.1 MAG: hypothetical protein A3C99_03215 [Candidatus Daviesbacteria bacterium RIFCSPHIGHO2_02_F